MSVGPGARQTLTVAAGHLVEVKLKWQVRKQRPQIQTTIKQGIAFVNEQASC